MLGLGIAMLAEMTDRTFRNPEEVEEAVGAPIIAHLPGLNEAKLRKKSIKGSLISPMVTAFHVPRGTDAETFRLVRTSVLLLAKQHSKKVFMLTSPSPSDGKSTVISNLAASMAQTGKQVLLVDADMRRPTIHKNFGTVRSLGLSDFLVGEEGFADCLCDSEQTGLTICPAGSRTSSPSELLESERFAEFMKHARESFDVVFLDVPPVLAVTDPAIIALHVDSCMLVVRIAKNNRMLVERAADILRDQGVSLDGVVINSRDGRRGGYGYSSYNYYGKKEYGYVESYRRYYESDEDESPIKTNGHAHPSANGRGVKVTKKKKAMSSRVTSESN